MTPTTQSECLERAVNGVIGVYRKIFSLIYAIYAWLKSTGSSLFLLYLLKQLERSRVQGEALSLRWADWEWSRKYFWYMVCTLFCLCTLVYFHLINLSENVMARPFTAPDPNDRSVNEPTQVVSANQVLGLYNQESGDKKERIVESVKSWYRDQMIQSGWADAAFHGNQCVVRANVELRTS